MCGIAAILKAVDLPCPAAVIDRMQVEVTYRGPDDKGSKFFRHSGPVWAEVSSSDSAWQVGLGHCRLSILDLSPAGHQPMAYRDKFWIVYNGEIYNFIELRTELERLGHIFRSSSDTEVILAAYAEWGSACFARFRGMWGLVILDYVRNEAILSRDRLGIKPLYLWEGSGVVAVASEIKQFRHVPGFMARINPVAATEYLLIGYEYAEQSFFRDVRPVPAGCWIRIPFNSLKPSIPEGYWHPERVQVSVKNPEEAGQLFAAKLRECILIHLRSDVPVGCALSGGLDSSSITVLMNELRKSRSDAFHTFTVTFPGDAIDEREYADAVLDKVQAFSHFVTPDPHKFLEDLDRFLWIHDEPVGSLSMYAGYCVARLTREAGISVALNGQGGDELLSGYWQSYFLHLYKLWKEGRLLTLARHFTGSITGKGNPSLVSQIPVMIRRFRARQNPPIQVRLRNSAAGDTGVLLNNILGLQEQAWRVYQIRSMFLPRLLKWEDRNSMAFSVEGRYPFLDHELIELCLAFAPQTLYSDGWTKLPLRLGLANNLPIKILHRRSKFGFETPQDKWLCGALWPELESWVRSDRPVWNYVERTDVRRLAEHTKRLNGKQDEPGQALFRIYVFDRWLNLFGVK